MRKVIFAVSVCTVVGVSLAVSFSVLGATSCDSVVGLYDISAIIEGVNYTNKMNITSFNSISGAFLGTGSNVSDPSTWTVSGTVNASSFTLHNSYFSHAPSYQTNIVGMIDAHGNLTGNYNSNTGQTGSWFATRISAPVCTSIPACTTAADCGSNLFTGSNFCQGNSVVRNFQTWTCNNAGTASSSCSSSITSQTQQNCSGNQTCFAGSCVANIVQTIACNSNADCGSNILTGNNFCIGNSIFRNYTSYTCNNAGTTSSYCAVPTTVPQLQQNCSSNQTCSLGSCTNTIVTAACTNHSYQQCSGNGVYWFDSCGSRQELYQACASNQVCSNNACVSLTNPSLSCISHAYQVCSGSNVYWTDSCGNRQELYKTCSSGQTCSFGVCLGSTIQNSCISQSYQGCVGNSLYWFNSCGLQQNLVKACSIGETCSYNKCVVETIQPTQFSQTALSIAKIAINLSDSNGSWSNSITAKPSDLLQFSVIISNASDSAISNIIVKDSFPSNLIYDSNLMVDGSINSGNIIVGLNIGNLEAGDIKTITYNAKVAELKNFSSGLVTLNNSVTVASSDIEGGVASASASIVVAREDNLLAGLFRSDFQGWWPWLLIAILLIAFIFYMWVFRSRGIGNFTVTEQKLS